MTRFKIETFLPKESLEDIRSGLYELGLGKIGKYNCCMSWYEVESSWKAIEGANPYIGKVGEIEFEPEYKLEFLCDKKDLKKAIAVIKKNHPYEEVGINIIPLYDFKENTKKKSD